MARPITMQAAMLAQGYRVKRKTCGNCANLSFKREIPERIKILFPDDPKRQEQHLVFTGLRCTVGGFSVKRTASCDTSWKPIQDTAKTD